MHDAVAQVAALVAHGNAALAGDAEAGARVVAGPTFEYVRDISFERLDGSPPVITHTEADPAGWFRRLAEWGVTALWFDPRPLAVPTVAPHLLAGRPNGSRASIVTEGEEEPRLRWIPSWSVSRAPTETDRRTWTIRCVGQPDVANLAPRPTIADAAADLEAVVRAARDLAHRLDETLWAGFFERSLASLTDDHPATTYHEDVLPPSAELDRRRLFVAAVAAYVFGGMGTWNDVGTPPGDEVAAAEYDRVTRALYAAILAAVAAAVNPRVRDAPGTPAPCHDDAMARFRKGDRVLITEGAFKGQWAVIVDKDVIGDELTVALGEDGREIRTHEAHVEPAD